MKRSLKSFAFGAVVMVGGVRLGAGAEAWIRPDLTTLAPAQIRAELQRTAKRARQWHWAVGWAYAQRHRSLSDQIRWPGTACDSFGAISRSAPGPGAAPAP